MDKETIQTKTLEVVVTALLAVVLASVVLIAFAFSFWIGLPVTMLVIATTIISSLVRVDTVEYGVVLMFGRRTGRMLKEGIHLILPFGLETVEKIDAKLRAPKIEANVYSEDKLGIILTGSSQWRPDFENLIRFLDMSDDVIMSGIIDAIKQELGAIAGVHPGESFIKERETLARIINAVLNMEKPPHLDPKSYESSYPKDIVPVGRRISFYKKHAVVINEKIREASGTDNGLSVLERRYGVVIVTFALSSVKFTPETERDMALKRQKEMEKGGVGVMVNTLQEGVQNLKDNAGVQPEKGLGAVMAAMGLTAHQTIDMPSGGGRSGNAPVVVINTPQPINPATGKKGAT